MDTTTLTPRSLVAALVEARLRGGAVESIAVVEPLGRGTPQWPWGRLPRMPMWRRFLALLTGLGRGKITGAAGDDAGGIATYASVRAQYGYTLLWALGLITVSLIVVLVQVARLGAVTGKRSGGAYPRAVRGPLDGRGYVRAADRQRSRHHGGVRRGRRGARPVRYSTNRVRRHSAFVVWLIVVRGSCSAAEKILLVLGAALLTYVAAAVLARPNWSTMAVALVSPSFSLDAGYLTTFTTLVGTTIAPYILFYLQSSISDKGLGLAEYPSLRTDVVIGSVLSDVVAAFSSICTAATLFAVGVQVGTADDAARALTRLAGSYATVQFALGLSGTSMLAASVLPLSTAYAICGAFGWGARCLIPLARSPGR